MWLLSGIGGVILAYFLNRMAVTKYKRRAIIYLVPAIEETCKTVAGYLTSSILLSHLIFGIAEAVNDYIKASYKINLRASILSILSHSFFGITSYILVMQTNIFLAIIVTSLIHGLWNRLMLR
ncbi:MAG: hypothetical protein AB2462_02465 [Thermoanaerobacter sp.]|uniref:Uncharacterized protein n=1 Tax=Thermoanaerobacter siderophilus SR4 TaxID=880478 RepID=I8QYF4_9THEO|nr:hypothetical protein [Thermoanaerobacter siderophilus]EGD51542.1 hypothetical protein TheetDRAFT_1635 [Thermoanaerobacter ethanolicus JW 200]EIW00088.1 hypothetical protein ThesiDRAFT1_1119 [Thermoanaerobacter siderophilus SR4]MBZ4656811.1 hypothetical protein [Thermoanaerobacter sp.]HHY79306.1 hypothetical protein [Thermoanaerobacter sp.]